MALIFVGMQANRDWPYQNQHNDTRMQKKKKKKQKKPTVW